MASLRDKIATNAQPYLQPGEQVQGVFSSQTANQYLIILGAIIFLIANNYRTVIATDRRILVCDSGKWRTTNVRSIVAELPRGTRLGPAKGLWFAMSAGPQTLRVHKRFHKDIAAIDAAVGHPA